MNQEAEATETVSSGGVPGKTHQISAMVLRVGGRCFMKFSMNYTPESKDFEVRFAISDDPINSNDGVSWRISESEMKQILANAAALDAMAVATE